MKQRKKILEDKKMSYYSVADINIEIVGSDRTLSKMEIFCNKFVENVDVKYEITYLSNKLSYEFMNLIYEGILFAEYEDGEHIYRIFEPLLKGKRRQVVVERKKEQYANWNILLDKEFMGKYPEYFNFAHHLAFETVLCQFQGFILHSSVVSYQGKGILFSAPSGMGKSTQAELWEKYKQAEIINGDRACIRRIDGRFFAYGSPLAGSSGIYKNQRIEIKAIIILKQAKENSIRKLCAGEAFCCLYRETLINMWDKQFVIAVTGLISNLIDCIPVYELACRPDEDAVNLVYDKVLKN